MEILNKIFRNFIFFKLVYEAEHDFNLITKNKCEYDKQV